MAENPAYWKRAETVIDAALEDHAWAMSRGVIGATSIALIANRLREAGLLNDQDDPHIGWDGLREYHDERERIRAGREG